MALTDDLVAYWTLDEASGTRADSHGSLDLAEVGSVGSTAGVLSSAATGFTGSDYLSRSRAGFEVPAGGVLTVSVWVRQAMGVGGASQPIASLYHSYPGEIQWLLRGGLNFNQAVQLFVRAGGSDFTVSEDVPDGVLCHVVAEVDDDGKTITLWVNDGAAVTTSYSGTPEGLSTAEFRVGQDGPGESYSGDIDELGVWTRALTSQERADLYNGGSGLAYPFGGGGGSVVPKAMHLNRLRRAG